MKKKIVIATFAVLGLGVAAPSYAQWYVGASVGRSHITFDNAALADQFLDLGFTSATTISSTRGTGYRAFGGYQLQKYVAAEVAYIDAGRFQSHSEVTPAGVLTGSTKIDGVEVAAVGTLPIGDRFSIFGRVGAFAADTRTSYMGQGSVSTVTGGDIQERRQTRLSYGAGASYNIDRNVSVRADWSRYTKLGDDFTGGKTDVNLYAIGVVYKF